MSASQPMHDSLEVVKEKRIKFSDVVDIKRDERRKKHRTHPRRRRSAHGRAVGGGPRWNHPVQDMDPVAPAPTNTTQFIINDHNSPLPRGINGSPISACPTPNSDAGSRSRDGQDYDSHMGGGYSSYSSSRIADSAIEQFAEEYSQFQYERLCEMNREDLINKCIELEEALDCYDRVNRHQEQDTGTGSSSESEFNSRPFSTSKHCNTCTCVDMYTAETSSGPGSHSQQHSTQTSRGESEDENVVGTTTRDLLSPPKTTSSSAVCSPETTTQSPSSQTSPS